MITIIFHFISQTEIQKILLESFDFETIGTKDLLQNNSIFTIIIIYKLQ